MEIKVKRQRLPLEEIKISRRFSGTRAAPKKVHDAYSYYTAQGKFDRDIVIDRDGVLTDGYAAYLVAKMLDVKELPVLRVVVSFPTPAAERFETGGVKWTKQN